MNSEDFGIHIQRQSHKDHVSALMPKQQYNRSNNCSLAPTMPMKLTMPLTPTNNTIRPDADRESNQKVVSANIALNDSGNSSPGSRASSVVNVPSNRVSTMKLADVIDASQFPKAIIATAIDLTSRTHQRISHENQILNLLMAQLRKFDSTLRMLPFGSTTYGFGGTNTNFNVLINTGKHFATEIRIPLLNLTSL